MRNEARDEEASFNGAAIDRSRKEPLLYHILISSIYGPACERLHHLLPSRPTSLYLRTAK